MDELTAIPATLDAGTACTIRRTLDDYPASESWILTLHLQGLSAAHVAAAADEDDHVLTLTGPITAALTSGSYQYLETVARGEGASLEGPYPVSRGRLYVRPDLINATAGSLQDPDEKALAIVREVRDGRLANDIAAYQLEQLGVTREQFSDIHALETRLRRRIWRKHNPGMFAGTATVSLRRAGGSSASVEGVEYDE